MVRMKYERRRRSEKTKKIVLYEESMKRIDMKRDMGKKKTYVDIGSSVWAYQPMWGIHKSAHTAQINETKNMIKME